MANKLDKPHVTCESDNVAPSAWGQGRQHTSPTRLAPPGGFSHIRKRQRMPNPISYTRLRTPLSYNMHLLDGVSLTDHDPKADSHDQ